MMRRGHGMVRRATLGLCAAAMLLPLTACATLASTVDDPAMQLAQEKVPAGSVYQKTEREHGFTEYTFEVPGGNETYEVTINDSTGAVFSVESEVRGGRGGNGDTMMLEQAGNVVRGEWPDAQILYGSSKRDDGAYEYTVLFESGDMLGKYDLNTDTGAILERDMYYGTQALMRPDAIVRAIQAAHPGAEVTHLSLGDDDGIVEYSGKATLNGARYEFEVRASDGQIIEWEIDD